VEAVNAIVKIQIQGFNNRVAFVQALADEGYKVWVKQKIHLTSTDYYVLFELKKIAEDE